MERPDEREVRSADPSVEEMDARDQVNAYLIAGTLGVGGFITADGGIDLERLRAAIAERLTDPQSPELARFTQRVRMEGRVLFWEACTPDFAQHIRLVAPVDGMRGLTEECATLMTVPLPLDRPLWELLIVPEASPAGAGIILRVHHALADGVAVVRLLQQLFGTGSPPGPAPRLRPATPPPARPRWRRVATSLSRVTAVFRAAVPPTVLLGPIGAHRGVAFTDVDLDAGVRLARIAAVTREAKSVARAQGTYELTRTRWGSRLFAWLARRQRFITVFVTNVHGPDQSLQVAGAPLERVWPLAPIQGNVRLGITALSYAGRLAVTVHADAQALRADLAGRALGDELARIAHPGVN